MSKMSFKTFCIEMYAEHAGQSSPEIFSLFRKTGLLEMLDTDYEDLHGLSWGYLNTMFDEYLSADLQGA
jgi:hypothetical protein